MRFDILTTAPKLSIIDNMMISIVKIEIKGGKLFGSIHLTKSTSFSKLISEQHE